MGKFVDIAIEILEQCKTLEASAGPDILARWNDYPDVQLAGPAAMAKGRATSALLELSTILKTPTETVSSLGMKSGHSFAFQALYRFKIADHVPAEGDATYEDVAVACGMSEQDLRRVVRYLITFDIFDEPAPNRIAHNGPSRAFRENKLLQQGVGMVTEELIPTAVYQVDAMVKWPGSGELNHCGSTIAHSTEIDFFHEISKSPSRAERFADAMTFMARMPGLAVGPLVDAYDWNALGEATVVDIGGSHGELARRILLRSPKLKCVVQDLASTIDGSHDQDRLLFMKHNFFDVQPLQADAYILRWILHDWPDNSCVKVLQNLRPALNQGAHILILDFCVSEPGQAPRLKAQAERVFDLTMWAMNNGKERSRAEWNSLIELADPRFKLENIIAVPNCLLCILDITWGGI